MRYDTFLAELGKAELSVRALAQLIGMNPNSVSNYASNGDIPRHPAVIVVLLAELNIQGVPKVYPFTLSLSVLAQRGRGSAEAPQRSQAAIWRR